MKIVNKKTRHKSKEAFLMRKDFNLIKSWLSKRQRWERTVSGTISKEERISDSSMLTNPSIRLPTRMNEYLNVGPRDGQDERRSERGGADDAERVRRRSAGRRLHHRVRRQERRQVRLPVKPTKNKTKKTNQSIKCDPRCAPRAPRNESTL